ncbi:hypothetical protein FO519_009800 [Halicephalobus sp. NKZ332]|nr:hypothetical protein FO519_009800 [Halicephalobus sp. NKZ332]
MPVVLDDNGHSRNAENRNYRPGLFTNWFNSFTCKCDVDDEPLTISPVSFIELFRFGSRTDKLLVIIGVICGIISGMSFTSNIVIRGRSAAVLLKYSSGDSKLLTEGYPYVALNLSFGVGVFILALFQNFLLKKACTNIVANLRIEFIRALLRQDAAWLDKQKLGVLNAELTENIDVVKDGIGEKMGMVIRGFSALIGCCIFDVFVNWRALLIIFGAAPISILLISFMGRLINITTRKQLPHSEKAAAILQESLINVKTVQCCNGEKEIIDHYCKALQDGRKYGIMSFFWNGLFNGSIFFVLYLFYAVTF